MGNSQSHQQAKQKYSFADNYNDPRFGITKIYRKNQPFYDYVVLIQKHLQHEKIHFIEENLMAFHRDAIKANTSPFLRILQSKIQQGSSCKLAQIQIYLDYLRHDLKQFFKWRRLQGVPLTYQEVVLTIRTAIDAYKITKNNQIAGVSLKLDDIYVTLSGEIKFHPLAKKLPEYLYTHGVECFTQKCRQQTDKVKQRFLERKNIKQSIHPYAKNATNKHHQISTKQLIFVSELKQFVSDITWDCHNKKSGRQNRNPEQNYHQNFYPSERKQIKTLIREIVKAQNLHEIKHIIGKPQIENLLVEFQKLKHDQSQSRFEKLLSQLSEQTNQSRQQLMVPPNIRKPLFKGKHINNNCQSRF